MRAAAARRVCAAALAALALGGSVSGCGADPADAGGALTIYSLLPLAGERAAMARDVGDGEKLALAQAGGRVGGLTLSFRVVGDVAPDGRATAVAAAAAAQLAVRDATIIAAIGDLTAPATAVTAPVLNAAGVLQVSPATTDAGLAGPTAAADAGRLGRLEPSGRRSFARVIGSDASQARAAAALARRARCHGLTVVAGTAPAERSLAALVARAAGARLRPAGAPPPRRAGSCAFLALASPGATAAAAFRAAHRAAPRATLLGPAALVAPAFAAALGPAAPATRLVSPAPDPGALGARGRRFAAAFERELGRRPGPYAMLGYDAMRSVIASIRRAGARGDNRRAVIDAYLGKPRPSLLGPAATTPAGETSPARWFEARVAAGRLRSGAPL